MEPCLPGSPRQDSAWPQRPAASTVAATFSLRWRPAAREPGGRRPGRPEAKPLPLLRPDRLLGRKEPLPLLLLQPLGWASPEQSHRAQLLLRLRHHAPPPVWRAPEAPTGLPRQQGPGRAASSRRPSLTRQGPEGAGSRAADLMIPRRQMARDLLGQGLLRTLRDSRVPLRLRQADPHLPPDDTLCLLGR